MSGIHRSLSFHFIIAVLFIILFYLALCARLSHIYLEDDFLWLLPYTAQLKDSHSLREMMDAFRKSELTLFDGFYFLSMLNLFGFRVQVYVFLLIGAHLANVGMLYQLIRKRLKLSPNTAFCAALIFLTFLGHFHVYLWPISAHHIWVVFSFLLLSHLYLKTNELIDENKNYRKAYAVTILAAVAASFLRMSILMFPLSVMVHLFFTALSRKGLLKKYDLWAPVAGAMMIVQLMIIAMKGEGGESVQELLNAGQGIFKSGQTVGVIFLIVLLGIGLRVVLFFWNKYGKDRPPSQSWNAIFYLLVLIPHWILLCLYLWTVPWSAVGDEQSFHRWQMMSYPQNPLVFSGFVLISSVSLILFIHFVIKHNRHSVLFLVWYACLAPFLGLNFEDVPSRYLSFVSPVFALMMAVLVFEYPRMWFPNVFRKWEWITGALIAGLCLLNLACIHLRIFRTTLMDYSWCYDYIKMANVIKNDLTQKEKRGEINSASLCIRGARTDADAWGFLKGTSFDAQGPLTMTLQSVIRRPGLAIHIENCSGDEPVYYVNDRTITDARGDRVEPFYRHFEQGVNFLKSAEMEQARLWLSRAVETPPFYAGLLMRLNALQSPLLKMRAAGRLMREAGMQFYYDETGGYPFENMVSQELPDYGLALSLLSYLEKKAHHDLESRRLIRQAMCFLASDEIFKFPLKEYLGEAEAQTATVFFAEVPWPKNSAINALEQYRGFNIFWMSNNYFAAAEEAGALDLIRYKRNESRWPVITAKSKHQIRSLIDEVLNNTTSSWPISSSQQEYQGFLIETDGDGIRAVQTSDPQQSLRAGSVPEAKLAIDSYRKL